MSDIRKRPERKVRGWSYDSEPSFSQQNNNKDTGKSGSGKTSSGKGSKLYDQVTFCNNCDFSARWEDVATFQVINGVLDNTDQIVGAPDDIAICDNCKCQATNSLVVIANVEGECDIFQGIDVLEFTASTTDEAGDVDMICPDTTYEASISCETYALPDMGGPRTPNIPSNTGLMFTLQGPTVNIDMDNNLYMHCIMV